MFIPLRTPKQVESCTKKQTPFVLHNVLSDGTLHRYFFYPPGVRTKPTSTWTVDLWEDSTPLSGYHAIATPMALALNIFKANQRQAQAQDPAKADHC